MRKIIHISDMHFGRIDQTILYPLSKAIEREKPNLVIISGDFTQRARTMEFKEAKSFVDNIKYPMLVIPGNHDISPLFSPLARIFAPYKRYKKYISEKLEPVYIDNEIAVAGMNTVRSHAIKDGRINKKQIANIKKWFGGLSDDVVKIVVTHHPLDTHESYGDHKLAKKSFSTLRALSEVGVDAYLSGHFHFTSAVETVKRHKIGNYSAIAIQAGTVSTRTRHNEKASFNIITINKKSFSIAPQFWNPKTKDFEPGSEEKFIFDDDEKKFIFKNSVWHEISNKTD